MKGQEKDHFVVYQAVHQYVQQMVELTLLVQHQEQDVPLVKDIYVVMMTTMMIVNLQEENHFVIQEMHINNVYLKVKQSVDGNHAYLDFKQFVAVHAQIQQVCSHTLYRH